MNLYGITFLQYAANEMTLAEKGISSAKVILTGFVVVFAVLLLLIGIIKLYSFIIGKAQGAADGKKKKAKKAEASKEVKAAAPVKPAQAVSSASAISDEIPEEVVAVISAAVATVYGSSGKARIKSIKKSSGGRSAWANAGVLENTRPF